MNGVQTQTQRRRQLFERFRKSVQHFPTCSWRAMFVSVLTQVMVIVVSIFTDHVVRRKVMVSVVSSGGFYLTKISLNAPPPPRFGGKDQKGRRPRLSIPFLSTRGNRNGDRGRYASYRKAFLVSNNIVTGFECLVVLELNCKKGTTLAKAIFTFVFC